ncbi:30S ribosomal protein S5 [bacterium]|nr:30S ribosomal protein S5 [bacterium]
MIDQQQKRGDSRREGRGGLKGGRHFGFSVLVCVGDQKGRVGIAIGKANAVPDAVKKGLDKAKKCLFRVPIYKSTIPHPISAKYGASMVIIKPAAPGTGVIAGGAVRAIFEALGVKDILSKKIGSSNPINVTKATLIALKKMRSVSDIAKIRNISAEQVLNG